MSTAKDTAKQLMAQASGSGYRAAGLCASRHSSGVFCTRGAKDRHGSGKHRNPYIRSSPQDAIGLRW
ncbi:hypothetical protein [Streptomyces fuscichromogenes]|uniref:Uncharacterized protein n=1 Tax=Streptomyces fuscichromogenes TaxID=1324013 RepID=A0A917XPY0_9ACTN|nr:hypothetical protein [Streptomyces fuscichromogenes]GGN46868.1 hypothetical protein GCM10011578_100060 [Streptomyces fuscichromogenes]